MTLDPSYASPTEVKLYVKTRTDDKTIEMLIKDVTQDVSEWESYTGESLSERDKRKWIQLQTALWLCNREPEANTAGDIGSTSRQTQIEQFQKEIDEIKAKYGVSSSIGAIVVQTEEIP